MRLLQAMKGFIPSQGQASEQLPPFCAASNPVFGIAFDVA
jgi:hypothetical protein